MKVWVVYAKDDPACTRRFFPGTTKGVIAGGKYCSHLGKTYDINLCVFTGAESTEADFIEWLNEHAGV